MAKRTEITVIFELGQYLTLAGNRRMDDPRPGTSEWCAWLEDYTIDAFGFTSEAGIHYTARRESRQRGGAYWYAYRKQQGKLRKTYAGRTYELMLARLVQVADVLGERCTSEAQSPSAPAAEDCEVPAAPPMSARDCAKDLIRVYVIRGDTLESLAHGHMGSFSSRYHAKIGGLVPAGEGKSRDIGCWKLAVTRIGKQECCEIFSLRELYAEIQAERGEAHRAQEAAYLLQLGVTVDYWPLISVRIGEGEDAWRSFAAVADIILLQKAICQAIHLCRNLWREVPARPGEEQVEWCATIRTRYDGWYDHRQPGRYRDLRGNVWCQECFAHYRLMCCGQSLDYPAIEADGMLTVKAGYDAWLKFAQMAGHQPVFLMARIADQLLENHHANLSPSSDCAHRRCHRAVEYHDYLGHAWCNVHMWHFAFLNIGVILGFPALESQGVEEGKSAWFQHAQQESNGDRMRELLVHVQNLLVMEKFEKEPAA